tara:strand:- start:2 stop:196 length:195 start_codon:yes stop_codon:yes gene_type:complete
MENNIPTAEEFLKDNFEGGAIDPQILIEFAKLHVEAALNAACTSDGYEIDEESILNSYPLTNIK